MVFVDYSLYFLVTEDNSVSRMNGVMGCHSLLPIFCCKAGSGCLGLDEVD